MKFSMTNLFNNKNDYSFFVLPTISIAATGGSVGIALVWLNFAAIVEW